MTITLLCGDCRTAMNEQDLASGAMIEDNSIDSCVTDPPYDLTANKKGGSGVASVNLDSPYGHARIGTGNGPGGFMGMKWDGSGVAFDPATWREVFRVLKPGAHLLAFGGTRTYHRMVCAIEDAGFEIRDQIGWVYGSGFPKSLDVSKAIDKAAGAEREAVGFHERDNLRRNGAGFRNLPGLEDESRGRIELTAPATDAARQWQGWGTALKPAFEPLVVAQKPYTAQQILATLAPTVEELLCKVDSFAKTDMRLSELLRASGFLSTVSSLKECLDGISQTANRFTTVTANALTTDLRILRFSLSKLTQATTTGASSATSGVESNVWDAAGISRSVQAKCERLSATTAGEIAIDWSVNEDSDPEESRLSPNWRSIVVARKPLIGTVAANVLAHGTGALNIDGCRVAATDGYVENAVTQGINTAQTSYEPRRQRRTFEPQPLGRWPANIILSYPEDEYELRGDVTAEQRRDLFGWLHANA